MPLTVLYPKLLNLGNFDSPDSHQPTKVFETIIFFGNYGKYVFTISSHLSFLVLAIVLVTFMKHRLFNLI